MSTLTSDVTKSDSTRWTIVPVDREPLVYYVIGISGREPTTEMSSLTMPGVGGWAHNSEAIQLEQSLSHRSPPILAHSGVYSELALRN